MNTSQENTNAIDQGWIQELVGYWTETYKKSMSTAVVLEIIRAHGPIATQEIREIYSQRTGWNITERGLYRALKKYADSGLVNITPVKLLQPGAKRKDFTISPAGNLYLEKISQAMINPVSES